MDIYIQAISGICSEYMDGSNEKKEISNFVAPVKVNVTNTEDGNRISVANGCNMWKSCQNEGCYYSMAARMKSKS